MNAIIQRQVIADIETRIAEEEAKLERAKNEILADYLNGKLETLRGMLRYRQEAYRDRFGTGTGVL